MELSDLNRRKYRFLVEVEPPRLQAISEDAPVASAVYRNHLAKDGWKLEFKGCATLYELFWKCVEEYSSQPLHGRRPLHPLTKEVGPYEWQTYREAGEVVGKLARALASEGHKQGPRIGIYGLNSPEWSQAMQACNSLAGACVPLYDSLGSDAIDFIISHSEMEFVFCADISYACLAEAISGMAADACKLKGVCVWGDASVVEKSPNVEKDLAERGIKVWSWKELVSQGENLSPKDFPLSPPKPEDVCTYMYTSGTTGVPKGVVITHRALVSTIGAMVEFGKANGVGFEGETYLSFLTLAHIYSRVTEDTVLATGGQIGYWQGDIKKLQFDIAELRPTIFTGVPRVWERIHEKLMERLSRLGSVGRCIYDSAVSYKHNLLKSGYKTLEATPWLDAILFRGVIQRKLGGRFKLVVSGGAPLSEHLEMFIRVALGTHGGQGYGLTETMGGTFVSVPNCPEMFGTVGVVMPSMEFRLESVPELGYDANGEIPQGELCLRGPALFSGYLKNKEESDKAIDSDGFFHTGDIAELHPSSAVKIIDRKKNFFKLSQGEYVAVEKIECILKMADVVSQIWVYGDSLKSCLLAVVVPNEVVMRSEGFEGPMEDVCGREEARAFVMEQITNAAKSGKLKGFEKVKGVILESKEFDVKNNCLTPSYKLKRNELKKKYAKDIDDLYTKLGR